MAGCFDNTPHENLENCPNEDTIAGIATKLYYVPVAFVKSMAMPTAGNDFESRITLGTGGIVLNTGKAWKSIDVQVDENELKMLLPGFKPKNLGFIDTYKNTPCLYAVKDAEGKIFVIGSLNIGAYIESADATTGKKIDDNSGITMKVTANTKLFLYKGEISLDPAS